MNLSGIDWAIIFTMIVFLIGSAYFTKRYTRSTADFLAANRSVGRYLLTFAGAMAGVGAISIISTWQIHYKTGFGAGWWSTLGLPLSTYLIITGWIVYRYRETRVLTLAQFFGVRYGRHFRILAGTICWLSGLFVFGIFPAVGANFFINYCGFPSYYQVAGLTLSTFHSLIIGQVGLSLYFTLIGGQVSVIITDYLQSFFCNIVLVALLVMLVVKFPLTDVFDGLMIAPEGKSMVNPFDAGRADFSPWFFIVSLIALVFHSQSGVTNAGAQAYNVSAKTPHEAKMASMLGHFRGWGFTYGMILIPLVAYMIMHHPDYADQARQVRESLSHIENQEVRDQMLVPATMVLYMPVGLMGAFGAVFVAAIIASYDTQLHSWGSVLIQDIILPLRKKPFTTGQHIWALRLSIIFVAVFICIFSSVFRQTQHLAYFTAITSAIWLGGIGAVMIGGLYTKWGSTAGAYGSLLLGSFIAGGGLVLDQLWMKWYDENLYLPTQWVYLLLLLMGVMAVLIMGRLCWLQWNRFRGFWSAMIGLAIVAGIVFIIESRDPPWGLFNVPWPPTKLTLHGQWIFFFAMMASAEFYAILSIFRKPKYFNLDKMLHRGKYQIESEHRKAEAGQSLNAPKKFSLTKALGITADFTIGDKVIYGITLTKYTTLFVLFLVMTSLAFIKGFTDRQWCNYHRYILSFWIFSSFAIAIWLTIGGLRDLIIMMKELRTAKRDFSDDGRIEDQEYQEEDRRYEEAGTE